MRKLTFSFIAAYLFLNISVFAQDPKQGTGIDPFAKGNWSFDLNRIGAYNNTSFYRDDNKLLEQSDGDLNLQGMYFILSHFGLGFNYSSTMYCDEQSSSRSNNLGLKFQYGTSISANTYLYGTI